MAAAEDLRRGLVCSMLLFCVVASLWCIVNAIAVAIRDQAISIAVESFAAMGNQQPSGQRSVSGNDISELASGLSQLAMALQTKAKTKPNQKPKLCRRLRLLPSLLSQFQGTTIRRKLKEEVSLLYLLSLLFLPGLGAFSPVYPPGHGQLQDQFLRQCRFCKQVAYWREGICVNEWCRVTWLQLVECPVCFVSLLIF